MAYSCTLCVLVESVSVRFFLTVLEQDSAGGHFGNLMKGLGNCFEIDADASSIRIAK